MQPLQTVICFFDSYGNFSGTFSKFVFVARKGKEVDISFIGK